MLDSFRKNKTTAFAVFEMSHKYFKVPVELLHGARLKMVQNVRCFFALQSVEIISSTKEADILPFSLLHLW